MPATRRLAAIMFTDIVGYTALMGKDSKKALSMVRQAHEFQKRIAQEHNGIWLKEMGDGAMAQFNTAMDAVDCALEIQRTSRADFEGELRIGIHLGDITIENGDVFGDGVNIASRLESIADPGGIFISDAIEKAMRGQSDVQAQYLGEVDLKNVDYAVRTYALQGTGLPVPEFHHKKDVSGHVMAEMYRRGIFRVSLTYILVAVLTYLVLQTIQSWTSTPIWIDPVVMGVLILGFPVALYFGWNYERSPVGFVRTSSKQSWRNPYTASQRKPLTGSLNLVFLAALAILIYFLPTWNNKPDLIGEVNENDNSIAIIPWKTIGDDQEGLYFVEGVQEDLRTHLSETIGLKVKSGRSVERLMASTIPMTELNVRYFLTGSARKSKDRIRINVQLIEATTDDQLWGTTYDESYADIFDTQARIAQDIANALKIQLTPSELAEINERPTENLVAWDYYKRALFYFRRSDALNDYGLLQNAISLFQRALEEDPEFAEPYAYLAFASWDLMRWEKGTARTMIQDSILILANKALELDPTISAAYTIKADYFVYAKNDTAQATKNYMEALKYDPKSALVLWRYGTYLWRIKDDLPRSIKLAYQALDNEPDEFLSDVLDLIGGQYMAVGEYEKGEEAIKMALSLEPDNLTYLTNLSQLYRVSDQHEKNWAIASRAMEISPDNESLFQLALTYMMANNLDSSEIAWRTLFELPEARRGGMDHNLHMYAYVLQKQGKQQMADSILTYLESFFPDLDMGGYEMAKVNILLGNKEKAYENLAKAVEKPVWWGLADWMSQDPVFENIREEDRFKALNLIAWDRTEEVRQQVRALERNGEIPTLVKKIKLY